MRWHDLIGRGLRALVAALAVLSPGAAAAQEITPLRLATQVLPPYQMLEDGALAGVAVDRVRCALDAIGLPYELHLMDWSAAQLLTENGEMDGFFVGSSNAARRRFAVMSDPVIDEDLAWYMRPGLEIDPEDPADRLSARYSAKFATSKWLNLHRDGYNVVMKPRDAESLLAMLANGDIDVALEYELIFEHFMARRGLDPATFRKVAHEPNTMGVHFSKRFDAANPAFRGLFNRHLATCIAQEARG